MPRLKCQHTAKFLDARAFWWTEIAVGKTHRKRNPYQRFGFRLAGETFNDFTNPAPACFSVIRQCLDMIVEKIDRNVRIENAQFLQSLNDRVDAMTR